MVKFVIIGTSSISEKFITALKETEGCGTVLFKYCDKIANISYSKITDEKFLLRYWEKMVLL